MTYHPLLHDTIRDALDVLQWAIDAIIFNYTLFSIVRLTFKFPAASTISDWFAGEILNFRNWINPNVFGCWSQLVVGVGSFLFVQRLVCLGTFGSMSNRLDRGNSSDWTLGDRAEDHLERSTRSVAFRGYDQAFRQASFFHLDHPFHEWKWSPDDDI